MKSRILTLFVSGLVVIFPFLLVFLALFYLWKKVALPFTLFLFGKDLMPLYLAAFFALLFVVAITIALGFLVRFRFMHALFRKVRFLFMRVPYLGMVYKATFQILKKGVYGKNLRLLQVSHIPFSGIKGHAFSFLLEENALFLDGVSYNAVLLLGTPNPLMGFILFLPQEEIVPTPWNVEEGVKTVLSAGIVHGPYSFLKKSN